MIECGAIRPYWFAALDDAGFGHEEARLVILESGESRDGCLAKYWAPRTHLDPEVGRIVGSGRSTQHVVGLWADHPLEGQVGLLRHELEHARQLRHHGEELRQLFLRVERRLMEELGGLPGGTAIYQEMPMEHDANAAASRFVRALFGVEVIDARIAAGDCNSLVLRAIGPGGRLESLLDRMVEFLKSIDGRCAAFRARAEAEAR